MSANDQLVPGTVLGRYELLLPIAQGGMATVWAARQKGSRGFQKTVAVKTMLPALSDDPQFEKMFLDEAALAARIHHPNVAETLDLGEENEVLYLVMEWIEGEALNVVHKAVAKNDARLPQRVALKVIMQACAGLHAAHELRDENDVSVGLVHRDVSPQNILVTFDGQVKLVDFGVAKATSRAGGETNAGQLKGKVPYMSPEQARGGVLDRRTDIFAMGIVLYRLTTGIHPFVGDNDLVTMRNIISRPVLPPRVKMPKFSSELEHVLLTCLQKDPDKRYGTMLELEAALGRALGTMGSGDDDVGAFMRTLLGDRAAKRKAAIRDAVRAADERAATGVRVSAVPTPPIIHDAISDLVVTKLATPPKLDVGPDRPSQSSSASEATKVALATATSPNPGAASSSKRSRIGLAAALVLVAGAIVGAVVFANRGAPVQAAGGPSDTAPAARPPSTAAEVTPAPTGASSAAPSSPQPTSSTLSIDDLPTTEDRPQGHSAARPTDPRKHAASAEPSAQPKQNSKKWVPAVQNPGF